MGDIAIRVEGIGKRYAIGERGAGRQFFDTLRGAVLGQSAVSDRPNDTEQRFIWALRNVSFEVKRGEIVGIIGQNGAGKSTLLKMLSRITRPTRGFAEIYGRVGALLEVGTGFHPELTGRENIFLNGAILGMRRYEIVKKFDEIVEFAGVSNFIGTPVKHYSSGMYVRLAFAVAAHLDPEVLLVDEVLAVGDVAFQKRCIERIGQVTNDGRTVIFVSHNMAAIARLCHRALWLDCGHIRSEGLTEEVVSEYMRAGTALDGERAWMNGIANRDVSELRILAVRIRNDRGSIAATIDVRRPFAIEIEYEIFERLASCRVGFRIDTIDGVAVVVGYDADDEAYEQARMPGRFISRCVIPGQLFNPGRFVVSIHAGVVRQKVLAGLQNVLSFDIEDLGAVGSRMATSRIGVIRPRFNWRVERIEGTRAGWRIEPETLAGEETGSPRV